MGNKKDSIPKEQDYKVKYVFNETSNVDINNIIKNCFITKLKVLSTEKITL